MSRRRVRLVPRGCTEQFEISIAAYFDADGQTFVAANVSEPDDPHAAPPLHEVLGVIRLAEEVLCAKYEELQ